MKNYQIIKFRINPGFSIVSCCGCSRGCSCSWFVCCLLLLLLLRLSLLHAVYFFMAIVALVAVTVVVVVFNVLVAAVQFLIDDFGENAIRIFFKQIETTQL